MQFTTGTADARTPYVDLRPTSWDDHGFRTSFQATYFDRGGERHELGWIKFLQRGQRCTQLPELFEQLPSDICSLPQSVDFDVRVARSGLNLDEFRNALRDIRVLSAEDVRRAESEPGYLESLSRFAPARFLLDGERAESAVQALISIKLAGFIEPHEFALDLDSSRLLGRIAVLAGENGTGKTQLLVATADALAGIKDVAVRGPKIGFARIITLSFNAYDQFYLPRSEVAYFYRYVGLRRRDMSTIDISARIRETIEIFDSTIAPDSELLEVWNQVMRMIAPSIVDGRWKRDLSNMASGIKNVIFVYTRLIAEVRRRSFILFDEPELHMHPRMLFASMRALAFVLERFDSYALLATHSPILLQEIPSSQIYVVHRTGDVPTVTKCLSETLGESIDGIIREVFEQGRSEHNYHIILTALTQKYGVPRVTKELGDHLGLPGAAWLMRQNEGG